MKYLRSYLWTVCALFIEPFRIDRRRWLIRALKRGNSHDRQRPPEIIAVLQSNWGSSFRFPIPNYHLHLVQKQCCWYNQSTLISLINLESTLTDFEKFHPPKKKIPPPNLLISLLKCLILLQKLMTIFLTIILSYKALF